MSLIFRSVKKISKKKRKTGSKSRNKKCFKDPFEDNPTKFVVEDEEKRSDFPTLNAVYKTELFGTPLPFRSGNGYDCMKFLKIKTKLQSIIFMNEYMNKSFEELRWEDYQCNRKGSHIFQEKNYLKCLSKDTENVKWKTSLPTKRFEAEPVHSISNAKFPALTKPNPMDVIHQPQKIILQRPKECSIENKTVVKSKERSILTNVNKLGHLKETKLELTKPLERERIENIIRSNSDINLKQPKKEEMVKDNLQRYFSTRHINASVPYELYSQNNDYFLPCTTNLTYKNKQMTPNTNHPEDVWDPMKTNPFGYSSIFDKLNPLTEKGSLNEKVSGFSRFKERRKVISLVTEKYTPDNKFSKTYFLGRFSPYPKDGKGVVWNSEVVGTHKCVKSKKHWLGFEVVS